MKGGKKPQTYFTVSIIIVLIGMLQDYFYQVPIEMLFPGHAIYYIVTYILRYPNSHPVRRFLITFALSFSEIIITQLLFRKSTDESIKTLIAEFVILYFSINFLSTKEIYMSFKNKIVRTAVFNLEALWRAILLTSALNSAISIYGLTQYTIFWGVCLGVIKLITPALVHVLDGFFFVDIPIRDIAISGISTYAKNGMFVSALIMILLVIKGSTLQYDILYETQANLAKLVSSIYFMLWYTHDSIEYGTFFK